jgi:uncharacterized RDD family membrane protein YckC
VSDIPVGSPPAPPGRHAAPSGWYPDPVNPTQERYWDGWQWSRNTRPVDQAPTGSPYAQPPYAQPSYAPYPESPSGRPPLGHPRPRSGSLQATATADGVLLASWWWRALAAIIDYLIISAIVGIITFPIWRSLYGAWSNFLDGVLEAQRQGVPPPTVSLTDLISGTDQLILTVATLAVAMLYHVGFLRWKSATPGKLICGLRVVPVDRGRDPGPLAWSPAIIRTSIWVLPSISSLLSLITVADALFPLWHPRRQALHDLAAKTQVTRRV